MPKKEAKLALSLNSINKGDFLFGDESYYILQVPLLSQLFQMGKSTPVVLDWEAGAEKGWAKDGCGWLQEGIF